MDQDSGEDKILVFSSDQNQNQETRLESSNIRKGKQKKIDFFFIVDNFFSSL